jgi:hypothetical protein
VHLLQPLHHAPIFLRLVSQVWFGLVLSVSLLLGLDGPEILLHLQQLGLGADLESVEEEAQTVEIR